MSEKKMNILSKIKLPKGSSVKNEAALKRGSFTVVITVLVVVALIAVNLLASALAKRINLEFDISPQKINTISKDNVKFIKNVKTPVTVTVCSSEDQFFNYMAYVAQGNNAESDEGYFKQTLNIVKKYGDYNDKIEVNFVDPQTSEFLDITNNYSDLKPTLCDIIVSAKVNGNERHKLISFTDIYELSDPSGYAAYGYSAYTVGGNKIETALTSAIAFVTSEKSKKAFFIAGHSAEDHSAAYSSLLKLNNYEIEVNSDAALGEIPADADIAVIMAPNTDFSAIELEKLGEFLDNGGKLGKGLVFMGSAACPRLPNLCEFLAEWGIDVGEGVIFETNESYRSPDDSATIILVPAEDDLTKNMNYFIAGNNIPMTVGTPASTDVKVTEIVKTNESAAVVPIGSANDYAPDTDSIGVYDGALMAVKSGYDSSNNAVASYVFALSSIGYIDSEYAETSLPNKDLCLAVADKAANVGDAEISFVQKTISSATYSETVTAAKTNAIRIVFIGLIPLALIAVGIIVFIRRKNA